jgi:ribonuclease J
MKPTRLSGLKPVRTYERAQLFSEKLTSSTSSTALPLEANKNLLRIIPFGGVEEVGINMTAYEYGDDIIVVDMGLGFPEQKYSGINYIIPNYEWLEENKKRIRAVIITHAHMDHIGALPHILPRLGNPPVYSMPLSIGFIKSRLQEFNLVEQLPLHVVHQDDVLRFGNFTVEFFRVNHNIPDSVGLSINSPAGRVIHTGDWKLDFTPGDDLPAEMDKLAKWGGTGILALLSDSTNAKKPGYCASEAELHARLEQMFTEAKGRIVFASNALILTRIQQVLDVAAKLNRKVTIVGRSMQNNIEIALSLGYLKMKPGTIISSAQAKPLPDNKVVVLTTGAQGEDNAALARAVRGEHRDLQLRTTDTVIISSTPIPGNETAHSNLISDLLKQGVNVIHHKLFDIHISGHAQQEELKMMMALVKPKFLIPIHGFHNMLTAHANLALGMGMPPENVFVPHNGSVFEFDLNQNATMLHKRLPASYVHVDETAIGQVDASLFCDKEAMATAGVVSVILTVNRTTKKLSKEPELITRGFTYNKGSATLLKELMFEVKKHSEQYLKKSPTNMMTLETELTELLQSYILNKTNREPLVLAVVIEI